MAYLQNPQYGIVPGAPQFLNWWAGNQFNMSGLPQPTPAPAPLPPVSTAATPTPQDAVAQSAFVPPRTDTGGAQAGGGSGPGSGPGGLGGASGGGQDTTTSGYPGVYAQAPDEMNSQFGQAGGLLGMGIGGLAGIPGPGTALGALGGALDAARYNGVNAQYGIPGTVNPWGSALASVLSGIGIPFTDLNLARAFNVPTAQQRQNAILDLYGQPISREDMGFGAMAANAPNNPSAPFGNTGWGPGMNPTTSQYPPGFFENEAARTIAANPDIFGSSAKGAFDAGAYGAAMSGKGGTAAESTGSAADKEAGGGSKGSDPGGSTGSASDKGDTSPSPGGSGDTSREGGDGGYKYRGGLIGAPPGRYAAGGTVGRAGGEAAFQQWIRALPWFSEFQAQYGEQPNLRDPDYDYRRAYRAGVQPERYPPDANRYHWPSVTPEGDELKGPNHPTRWMEDFMQQHGRDPNEMDAPYQQGVVPGAYAAGGAVPATPGDNITPQQFGALRAINPPGPDDQIGALQTGEGVLTRAAMAKYKGLLDAANAGTLDPGRVKGLLTPAIGKPRRVR